MSVLSQTNSIKRTSISSDCYKPDLENQASLFRLKKIQIQRSNAIDQIRLHYDDGKTSQIGHDGGKYDVREVVFAKDEYLLKVEHESFLNFRIAGAGVTFYTNFGRVFSYQPQISSKGKDEITSMTADDGKEIVGLVIEKGILVGINQQATTGSAIKPFKNWYVIVQHSPKDIKEGNSYTHYHDWLEAQTAWQSIRSKKKGGRALVFIDAMKLSVTMKSGNRDSIDSCIQQATADGYCQPKRVEDVDMFDAVFALIKLLNKRQDIYDFIVVVICLITSSYCELSAAVVSGLLLASFSDSSGASASIDSSFWLSMLKANLERYGIASAQQCLIAAYMILTITRHLFYSYNVWIHHNSCANKNYQLRSTAFKHMIGLDQAFFDSKTTSEVKHAICAESISNLITWNVPYLVMKFVQLGMTFYFMASINLELAAITFSALLFVRFAVIRPLEELRKSAHCIEQKMAIFRDQIITETLDMIQSIKLFSTEEHHKKIFEQNKDRFAANTATVVRYRVLSEFSTNILLAVSFCFVLWQGMNVIAESGMNAGQLASFFLIHQTIYNVFNEIKFRWDILVTEYPNIGRYLNQMKEQPRVTSGHLKPELRGDIVFENVDFDYPSRPAEKALCGFSVNLKPYKMTAIVGDSGAGKSTITKLLMRLYDPKAGRISVDGVDLKEIDLRHLHESIAIVPQNPDLFDCSLGENISYGMEDQVTEEDIIAAAKLANCYDFIMKFRGGFKTCGGTRGSQLSAGQKQRISIARAAIRKPKVLILDEATSALDASNERLVKEALDRVMAGRTVVVIAHRLCTIKDADEIICMKEGRPVETGSHDQLVAARGPYFELINKQLVASVGE